MDLPIPVQAMSTLVRTYFRTNEGIAPRNLTPTDALSLLEGILPQHSRQRSVLPAVYWPIKLKVGNNKMETIYWICGGVVNMVKIKTCY